MIRRRWSWCLPFSATIPERFFSRTIALTASVLALRPAHLDDAHTAGCIDAAPAFSSCFTSRNCFFSGAENLTASRAAFCFSRLNNLSIDAAPRQRGWPRRRCGRIRNIVWRRSGLRPPAPNCSRRRKIRVPVLDYGKNEIQTGQRRKILDQRMSVHELAQIRSFRRWKFPRADSHVQ